MRQAGPATGLQLVGNIPFGQNKRLARNPDDPFVGAAPGRRRELRLCVLRNVTTNDGKVSADQLEDVRAPLETRGLRAISVRIGAKSSNEHVRYVNIRKYAVNSYFEYKSTVGIETESRAVCAKLFRILQLEREKRGLSKYAVAGKTGLAQQTLGYVEKGQTSPSFDTIYRIARAMDLDIGDLIERAEKQAKLKRPKK